MSAFAVRRLEPGDAAAYRTLMLQAYRDETDAFTSTVGEREVLPLAWWEARIADESGSPGLVVGAFSAARLVGAAGLTCERRERTSHKATLVGMYVHPDFRGRGAARALVRAILDEARAMPGVEVVQLTVTDTNEPAVRLYEACGFRTFGTEPFAVRLGDRFLTKMHMWRAVGDSAAEGPGTTNTGIGLTYQARKSVDEFLPARQGDTVLRRLRASDVLRFHGYRSDATLATYQGWSVMTPEQAEAFLAPMTTIAAFVPGEWVQLAIAEAGSDRLIGDVGVQLETDGGSAEVGFTLCREAQGRGHAIRAVEAARSLVFASTAAGLVRAVTDARNQGSVRVLERAGFVRLAERQALFKGERCTEFVYVCHRSET